MQQTLEVLLRIFILTHFSHFASLNDIHYQQNFVSKAPKEENIWNILFKKSLIKEIYFFSVEEGTSICEKTKTMLKQKKDEGTLVERKKIYAFGS